MNPTQLEKLQKLLKVSFNNPQTLFQALVHRSYLNENRRSVFSTNERLEFLGDAVIELWSSATVFNTFPDFEEGDMTNLRSLLVRTENLAKIAKESGFDQYILLSKGEEKHRGRQNDSILADLFEAITGAIFLDQGITASFSFLDIFLLPSVKVISQQKIFKDPKSLFQEIAQAKTNTTPHYQTLSETGPDHQKVFTVGAYLGDQLIAKGQGSSKQKAEENASISATKVISNRV